MLYVDIIHFRRGGLFFVFLGEEKGLKQKLLVKPSQLGLKKTMCLVIDLLGCSIEGGGSLERLILYFIFTAFCLISVQSNLNFGVKTMQVKILDQPN